MVVPVRVPPGPRAVGMPDIGVPWMSVGSEGTYINA